MKKIVIATDFSSASRDAIAYTTQLARDLSAGIVLLHVVYPPVMSPEGGGVVAPVPVLMVLEEQQDAMKQEVEQLRQQYGLSIEGMIKEGSIATGIVDAAEEMQAFMIVVGAKHADNANRFFGNTVTAVLRKSSLPVLVVPEGYTHKNITHITLAADFDSHVPATCYAPLHVLARQYNGHVHVVHVQEKDSEMSTAEVEGKMNVDAALQGIPHDFVILEHSDVEQALESFNTQHPGDLLVMVAHKHGFFARLFSDVHTRSMSYITHIPMLALEYD